MEQLEDQQITKLEEKILLSLNQDFQSIGNENVKKHLCHGFGIRLRMMSESRFVIHDKIENHDKDKALDGYTLNKMGIHLNAYYLNLKGSLDNLAWAINYFFQLQNKIDEAEFDSRIYTNLFKNKFLNDLKKHDSDLVKKIKDYEDWSKEIKQFRDPAAHRIPLQFVAGFLNEEQQEKINELEKEAEELFEMGNKTNPKLEVEDIKERTDLISQGFSKLRESRSIGSYVPTFISHGDDKKTIRYLPNQLGRDHSYFLLLSEFILSKLAANT